jgi:hypothetical protein
VLVVNGTVHVERAFTVAGEAVGVPFVTLLAAAIVVAFSLVEVVSALVLTASVMLAEPLVMPAIVRLVKELAATAHVPPLSASVMVTARPEPEPVAEQFAKLLMSPMAGLAGTAPLGKVTEIVSPSLSAPLELVVKGTVQITADALAALGDAVGEPFVIAVAAETVTLPAGLAGVVSALVLTENVVFVSAAAAGFVSPTTLKVAAALFASAHVPALFASVIVTV